MAKEKVKFFAETLGLHPFGIRIKQTMIALTGEEDLPRTKFGLSSLLHLHPTISLPLWFGRERVKSKVIISGLFNHTQTPIEDGWSVKKTQAKDFRGKDLTYDSHNGTDLAVPIGTEVLAPAPGEVVILRSEFNRGGLKMVIDHGNGLISCMAHLARAVVEVGDIVKRGQQIAISGYSGLDGFITCPWGIPHVHYNTWFNGEPVDPFAVDGERSLWRAGKTPKPYVGDGHQEFTPSSYDSEKVDMAIDGCITEKVRRRLSSIIDLRIKAVETIMEMNYYPTRFPSRVNIYGPKYECLPLLDLPFSKEKFDDIVFMDNI